MPQVSKRLVNPKTQEKIFSLFISGIIKCNNREITLSLVEDLLTQTERIMLAKRFSIAYMLLAGYDYRSISHILKVSTTTIGLVASWLKVRGNGFRKIIEKIKKDESLREILNEIQDLIEELIASTPGQNWSNSKRILWESRRERQKPF